MKQKGGKREFTLFKHLRRNSRQNGIKSIYFRIVYFLQTPNDYVSDILI